jgi:hypothetical protein
LACTRGSTLHAHQKHLDHRQATALVARGGDFGDEAAVPARPRTCHLHCASDGDPRPAGAGPGRGARHDSSLHAGYSKCVSKRKMRRGGAARDGKQAVLHQLVGDVVAVRPPLAEQGGLHLSCTLGCSLNKCVHQVCPLCKLHTLHTTFQCHIHTFYILAHTDSPSFSLCYQLDQKYA